MSLQDHWYIPDDADATNSGLDTFTGATWRTQTFTAGATYDISSVVLKLARAGTSTGNCDVEIRTTTGGKPDVAPGGVLCSGSVDGSTIGTAGPITFTFASPATLTSGQVYAIVASYPSGDGSHYLRWQYDNSGGTYSGGGLGSSSNSGVTWGTISTTADYHFKTYSALELVNISGIIAGVSIWAGTLTLLEFIRMAGIIAGVSMWTGVLTMLGVARIYWPPTRPAVPADDDTLHNNTLIAVGFDADGLGIIYFKET